MTILDHLTGLYDQHSDILEEWFAQKRAQASAYLYTSVDLRHSGHRLVPVDTNLYPAGFNNLSPYARQRASRCLKAFFAQHYPDQKEILIVPENHTRNLAYLENLLTLETLFKEAGLDVRVGRADMSADAPVTRETLTGQLLTQYPIVHQGDVLALQDGFVPKVIILNNDMSSGVPEWLEGLSQVILPSTAMGWQRRRKSKHFDAYQKLVQEFCDLIDLDPWLLCASSHGCGQIDFKQRTGLDCMAKSIEELLLQMRSKYEFYGIKDEPYVFIKADSGTYGMGVMSVRSPDDVFTLNKKDRNKMQTIKAGMRVSEVIIQGGVPTVDTVEGHVAEPMIYMIDGTPVGGMYRVNKNRNQYESLNTAGMTFHGMCEEEEESTCKELESVPGCHFKAYGTVAAIAALAAVREDYTSATKDDIKELGLEASR